MSTYFSEIEPVRYEGPNSDNPLAFHHYDADRVVLGKTLAEQLRFAVCYWHSFCWDGADVFGEGTFNRPWHTGAEPMALAHQKMDVAFEFFTKVGAPYWTFHDYDIAPEGDSIRDSRRNFDEMIERAEAKQAETGMKLLWGTAKNFGAKRYMAGAATNPNPEVFAYAASQVQHAMAATHRLGGANYVLWGGREGYETLLNTDLKREQEQLGRFMQMVVEYKHKIGFSGTLLIEPKPQEPTKHQYDYDSATVFGFLQKYGLEKEIKVNIEVNHATLAGHTFEHEVATAASLGILGSVDANRGDHQNGWDTDQFPNSVEEMTLACYHIIQAGGFTTGGFNFDTKLRRTSIAPSDLFHAHVGAMDVLALAFTKAAELVEQKTLSDFVEQRYAGWQGDLGRNILDGKWDLEAVADYAVEQNLKPEPVSSQQEMLENRVNRVIYK
ncbi:xylose isomerase [Saccharospirillum sp. MSK14-1]|uniref:xylose isomerase n=1 Tax=Saccharospirillum sp. MSK14-1 TaxID=1897632 RepID=UPI000D3726A6|nr:xylose isomerase [Saccharospirillum sp. MSK14-1]PTY35653.1 xylose isomerase [Saccharospirillum sp. MSK14-1]